MTRISIVGLGYIGMPTGLLFAKAGHEVVGFDTKRSVVERLRAGKLHIKEPGLQELLNECLRSGKFRAEHELQPADAFIICVPTPFKPDYTPDLTHVESASKAVARVARAGNLVVLESTVPVNATRDVTARILAEAGRVDVLVAHCPETVLPGNMIHELVHNERVIGGVTPEATKAAVTVYKTVVKAPIHETDAAGAEFVKLIENTYRDVNIALANELNALGKELGVDARSAIALANHHPRVDIHRPGPGVGGHCIPVDPWFLIKAVPTPPKLIATARELNASVPHRLAADLAGIVPKGGEIAILGLAYKGNVDDARESPSWELVEELHRLGFKVRVHDPYLPLGERGNLSLEDCVRDSHATVLVTDHNDFRTIDPNSIRGIVKAPKIIDTRAILDQKRWEGAGFSFRVW